MMKNKWLNLPVFAPENEIGSGGDDAAPAPVNASPESLLFASEKKPEADAKPEPVAGDQGATDASKKPEGEGEGEKKAEGAADWKEYVNDPNKSDADNAAAKAEHDKTKPGEDGDDADTAVPEKYELTMPNGVALDDKLLEAVTPVFKDLFLTNTQAQALTDAYIKHAEEQATATSQGWVDLVNGWADSARADKEIGGDKFDASVGAAKRAIDKLGTPELREYLDKSGGGNHPELIRILAKAGALIKEDEPALGSGSGSGQPVHAAHVLFPNDRPKGN